jgi:hypothetical protein
VIFSANLRKRQLVEINGINELVEHANAAGNGLGLNVKFKPVDYPYREAIRNHPDHLILPENV